MDLEMAGIANWSPHAERVDAVAERLQSNVASGLSDEEATRRLDVYGPNRIGEQPPPGKWLLLVRQFRDPLVLVLVVAASISGFLLGDVLEALVIVAIVVLNAAIGFIQEAKAADAAESLRKMTTPHARVIRSGGEHLIPTSEIVPGDLLAVGAGDRVPADARLITAVRLELDESELTGESQAVSKGVDAVSVEAGVGDRSSMVLAGTVVNAGRASALVTATGDDTEIGRIAGLLREPEPRTPLERELSHVGRRLGALAGVVALVVLAVGLVQGREPESMFLLAVALAVAAIPEGLPTVVAVTLSSGVQRMARHRAIVRKLQAVEALGAATVICTDKTGTLTRNEIAVREISVHGMSPVAIEALPPGRLAMRFAETAILCSDARGASGEWLGDPTEVALLSAASAHADVASVRAEWTRVDEVPFDATRKRMTTLSRRAGAGLISVKGAPEVVIDLCSEADGDDGSVPLDDLGRRSFLAAAEEMAGRGLRTMALAYEETAERRYDLDELGHRLVLVGVVGMSDSLRAEAKPSVEEAILAGVRVLMISGDHEVTTRAIAGDLGLLDGRRVMGGAELRSISDDALADQVDEIAGFARVDPEDKVRIVRAWQRRGEIVAMTGDGVNDAPAAHCGHRCCDGVRHGRRPRCRRHGPCRRQLRHHRLCDRRGSDHLRQHSQGDRVPPSGERERSHGGSRRLLVVRLDGRTSPGDADPLCEPGDRRTACGCPGVRPARLDGDAAPAAKSGRLARPVESEDHRRARRRPGSGDPDRIRLRSRPGSELAHHTDPRVHHPGPRPTLLRLWTSRG